MLKLLPSQFYSLTPRQFSNLIQAAGALFESEYKQEWEIARYQAYYTLKPYLAKADQTKPIKDIIALPWEVVQKPKLITENKERAANFWERADKAKI